MIKDPGAWRTSVGGQVVSGSLGPPHRMSDTLLVQDEGGRLIELIACRALDDDTALLRLGG